MRKGFITGAVALGVVAIAPLAFGNNAYALDVTSDLTLDKDYTEQLVIKAGSKVKLDLNGHDITTTDKNAIFVEKGAELTVVGNGKVWAQNVGKAPIINEGKATLNGGYFFKDEDMKNNCKPDAMCVQGSTQYYAIYNKGDMVINAGTKVEITNHLNTKRGASLVVNGNPSGTMVINGGEFIGGVANVKNDEGGVIEINGGTYANASAGALQNWNEMTINGGTFTNIESTDQAIITVGAGNYANPTKGILVINGGTFTGDSLFQGYGPSDPITVPAKITGGTFNVEAMVMPGTEYGDAIKETVITGGTFAAGVADNITAPEGYEVIKNADGTITIAPIETKPVTPETPSEEEKEDVKAPNTGANNVIAAVVSALGLSAVAIAGAVIARKQAFNK